MGDLIIKVTDADGRPLEGAKVEIEMLRHQFLFGCNIFRWGRLGNSHDEEIYRQRFAELFNYATLPFYWGAYEPKRGNPLHDSTIKIAEWSKEHGITTKGHPLFWNHPAGVPKWLPQSVEEVRHLAMQRIRDCVSRFKEAIDIWDVVNEATDPSFRKEDGEEHGFRVLRTSGVLKTVEKSFEAAQLANQAQLFSSMTIADLGYQDLLRRLLKKKTSLRRNQHPEPHA
jgi:GH35 family endo-1,4-beta-xylanase